MASFQQDLPHLDVPFGTRLGDFVWKDYFLKEHAFLTHIAKETSENVFTQRQFMRVGGEISDGGILLQNKYYGAIDLQYSSKNVGAHPLGGQAGIYLQHRIDSGIATTNNVNSGVRVQVETSQKRTGTLVNDVVGGYFGLRNNGTDVGAFGIHVDAYSNGAGAATTMYGVSAEMYRETNNGWTAAFHARSIDAVGYFDNDYGFLASPSVGGSLKFKKIFSGGANETGTMICDIGLDLAYADCQDAAIRIHDGQYVTWDGLAGAIQQKYDTVGEWQHFVSGTKNFGLENTGRIFIISNGNTDYGAAGVASGRFLAINLGGTVYKINLLNF